MAGLVVGYYAKKRGLPFTIYEATNRIGGNCGTLEHGEFLFDSGAHRFHDRDGQTTREIKRLLGEDLKACHIQSQIFYDNRFIDFPLSPLNLVRNMGLSTLAKAVLELVHSRLKKVSPQGNFKDFALYTYGKTLADLFLLNFTEKLWGERCEHLSVEIAGKRLTGLTLKSFLLEAVGAQKAKSQHLDGSFHYPTMGIGMIPRRLAECCGEENILVNSKITRVFHNYDRIQAIEINEQKEIQAKDIVSTLPMPLLVKLMAPTPPEDIMRFAQALRYRHVILVALFLNKASVTKSATVYFPSPDFIFTRIYEPKNRSRAMSPPGKTSLIAEIPAQEGDWVWDLEDERVIELVCSQISQIGWAREGEIIDASLVRMHDCYPVLKTDSREKADKIGLFLHGFKNLKISGRAGRFTYAWIHDMMTLGREIVEQYSSPGR